VTFFARLFALVKREAPKSPFEAGIAALDRRRFDEALDHFRAALEAASTSAERAAVHNKSGIAHLRRGDRQAAVEAFAEALHADARFVPVIVNIGNLLFEDGQLDEAVAHYEAALRIEDDYFLAHLNLGVAFKKLGRHADAVREFRRATRLEARFRRRGAQ
jgi:tetratricopeptide (TPR) repeat protein